MAKNWICEIEIGTNCFGEGFIQFNRYRDDPDDAKKSLHIGNMKYPIQTKLRSRRVDRIAEVLHKRCEARKPKTVFPYANTVTFLPNGSIKSWCGKRILMLYIVFNLHPIMFKDTLLVSN